MLSKLKKINSRKIEVFLIIILLIGFISSAIQLNLPLIAEGDAYSRVNVANDQKAIDLYFNKYGGTWLPFHFSLMVTSLSIVNDIHLVPRLITVLLSTGSLFAIYYYTKVFTNNKNVSIVSAFLYLIFPLRFFLSSQPLSEPVFIFFLLFGIIYIVKENFQTSDLLLGLIFINLAHGIRYESWFLLPILLIFILQKNIKLNQKILYVIFSLTFPILWLYLNQKYQGTALMFFNQKYDVAQSYVIPQYFNIRLSFSSWYEKLIPIFPFSFIFLSLFSLSKLVKNINPKEILFYSLPIYLYLLLVLQVFLGTMEWFPTRYLLIPTTFMIPILARGLVTFYISISKFIALKNKWMFENFFALLFLLLLSLVTEYSTTYKYTHLETNDWSLLEAYNTYQTIEESERYANLTEIIEKCKLLCNPNGKILFFYPDKGRTYLDQAIFYFLKRHGRDYSQQNLTNHIETHDIFIWEKSLDSTTNNNEIIEESQNYQTLFENDRFYIIKRI